MEAYARLVTLRNAVQNAPIQHQILQQQAQAGQQGLADQQAMTKAMAEWDGKDWQTLPSLILQHGGSGTAAIGAKQHLLEQQKTISEIAEKDATTGSKNIETLKAKHDALSGMLGNVLGSPDDKLSGNLLSTAQDAQQQGLLDPQHFQAVQQIAQLPPAQLRTQLQAQKNGLLTSTQQAEQAQKAAQARNENATASEKEQQGAFFKQMGLPAGITPEMAGYAAFIQKGGKPEGYAAFKAQQEAAATQPYKIQSAMAEGKARQLIQGMAEPVYAMDAQGTKTLMSKTDALQSGLKVILPVNEKTVGEDTMLINRLGDVHQKIAEYEKALQQPISSKDRGNLAGLLGTGGIKLGAFGTELPMDRVNAALNRENLKGLSPAARDQLVAYRNAREAMTGYTRVLSGSGRSSDKNLELQEQTLPDPAITDPDFSKRALDAFKGNLHVVGQGLPNIPGIKNPTQIEQEVWGGRSAAPQVNFQIPRPY